MSGILKMDKRTKENIGSFVRMHAGEDLTGYCPEEDTSTIITFAVFDMLFSPGCHSIQIGTLWKSVHPSVE